MIGKTILGYEIIEEIGSGGFGTVYKACKNNQSGTYVRALKHIALPTQKQYNDVLNSMGGDYSKADNYFADILKDIINEIQILNGLTEQGVRNVVWYYENQIDETQSPLHYDIYILMEYLTPFSDYMQKNDLTVRDVIALGKDVLTALIACHQNNVIHRDIKDDNIFISADRVYKLGDFGVSKKLQDRSRAESMKGTPNYIAPEVYLGREKYDNTVDLYSLGVVLYKLLNYNRNPFMPEFPNPYTSEDEDKAFEKRMRFDIASLPQNAPEELGNVIIKALAPRSERYNSAKEFYEAILEAEKCLGDDVLNAIVLNGIQPRQGEKNLKTAREAHSGYLQETIGEETNRYETKDKKTNGNLFETQGDQYIAPTNKEEKRNTPKFEEEPMEEEAWTEVQMHYPPSLSRKVPQEEKVAPIKKDSFAWLLYLAPVIILLTYVVLFFIILPNVYDNNVAFIDWAIKNPRDLLESLKSSDNVLPPIYKAVFLKVVHYILFGGFVVSLYFVGRRLHFTKPEHASNASLIDKDAYYLAMDIYEELKSSNIPNTADVLSSVKMVYDRLKNDSDFGIGNKSVIQCEKEIEALLNAIKSNIVGLENSKTYDASKQVIMSSCRKIMTKIKLRTELKKR